MLYILERKRSKVSIFFIIIMIFTLAFTNTCDAYSLLPYHFAQKSFAYQWGYGLQTPGSVIRNGFEYALTEWYSKADINIFYNSGAYSTLNSYNISSTTEYGYCDTDYNASTGYVTKFKAYINTGNSDITTNNVANSVAVHELGHPIGLNDLLTGVAVMNQQRDRTVIYYPQTDDIAGVSTIYN